MALSFLKVMLPVVLIFNILELSAQVQKSASNTIVLKTMVSGDSVKLRWVPGNVDIWRSSMQNGYTISRIENDPTYSISQKYATRVILAEGLKPVTEDQWEKYVDGYDTLGIAARNLIYNSDLMIQPKDNPSLQDAIIYKKNEEGRFFFMIMLAEQNYKIAEAYGLAFTDMSAEQGREYQYMITLTDPLQEGKYQMGLAEFSFSSSNSLPAPTEISAKGGDKHVVISWKTKGLDQYYTYYNIERKTESGFQVINNRPFMYMSDERANSDFAFYTDSLSVNNTAYIYRVVGITSFGNYGPPSVEVSSQGVEPALGISISMSNVFIGNDFAKLTWHVDPDSLQNRITRIDILRMIDIKDSLIMVNTSPLFPSDTSYIINNPPDVAYYVVQATDDNNYTYQSIANMIQLADTIPPAKPAGLIGKIRRDGLVILDWTANTDPDLEGYKVLFSNRFDGEYSQLTSVHVVKPHYETTIDPQFMADSIYFKVFAIDHRYNMSQWSDPLSLRRPDIVAPSESVINNLIAYEKGIAVYWSLSANKDVRSFELQRRISGSPNWITLLTFDTASIPALAVTGFVGIPDANFLDISHLTFNWYSYRIMAADYSGNRSYSVEKKVFPYDSGIRGKIVGCQGYIIPYLPNVDFVTLTLNPSFFNMQGGNLGGNLTNTAIDLLGNNPNVNNPPNGGNFNLTSYKKAVAFKWKYTTEFRDLWSFKLYRRIIYQSTATAVSDANQANSVNDSFVLIASIDPKSALQLGQLAGYSDTYIFVDEFPQKGVVHYEYKLRAEHKDGGFSQYSPVITIQNVGN